MDRNISMIPSSIGTVSNQDYEEEQSSSFDRGRPSSSFFSSSTSPFSSTSGQGFDRTVPLTPASFRDLLIDFLRKYDPSRLSDTDDLLIQYYDHQKEEKTKRTFSSIDTNTSTTTIIKNRSAISINQLSNANDEQDEDTVSIKRDIYAGYHALIQSLEEQYRVPGAFTTYMCDVRSHYYQPLVSLYTPGVIPPYPLVIPFDNLHKASVLVPLEKTQATVRFGVLHGSETKSLDNLWKSGTLPPGLLDWLASTDTTGPLSVLHSYYRSRNRICLTLVTPVSTPTIVNEKRYDNNNNNNPNQIYTISNKVLSDVYHRSYIIGFLRGFDNHWNILLHQAFVLNHDEIYPAYQQQQQQHNTNKIQSSSVTSLLSRMTFHEYLHQQDPYGSDYLSSIHPGELGKRKFLSSNASLHGESEFGTTFTNHYTTISENNNNPQKYPLQEQIFIPGYNIVAIHKIPNVKEPSYKVKLKLER